MPNIFDHLAEFGEPEHIYIVGAGANGAKFYKHIPESAFTMAANGAITAGNNPEFYPYPWTIWSAFDLGVMKAKYWNMRIPDETTIVMGPELATYAVIKGKRCNYWFPHPTTIRAPKNPLNCGGALGGATIVGCNLQIGWYLGATRFTFVGVDMTGGEHWDGSKAARGTGNWPQHVKMQYLINTMINRGATFNSLSKTALNIPIVDPGRE